MDFSLSNFTGYFEFDVTFSGSGTYDISIPLPDTPVGGTVSQHASARLHVHNLTESSFRTLLSQLQLQRLQSVLFPPSMSYFQSLVQFP